MVESLNAFYQFFLLNISKKIKQAIFEVLAEIAPEIDPATVPLTACLQEEFEIDSMDYLRIIVELSKIFSITIPESDYSKVATLEGMIGYIEAKDATTKSDESF